MASLEKTGWLAEQFSKAEEYYQSLPTWKRELIKNNSDPNLNEERTGTLGEGAGVRETTNLNHEFKKSDESLEEAVEPCKNAKKFLTLIGEKTQIRCHRCATAKNDEDVGVFIQVNNYIAWFHNQECKTMWHETSSKNYKTGADIDQSTGHEVIETQNLS